MAVINSSTARTLIEDFRQTESLNKKLLMTFLMRQARNIFGTEIILLIVFSVFLPAAWAETTQGQTSPTKIVAVLHCDYMPVCSLDMNTNTPAGFFVDIMDTITRETGLQVHYICRTDWSQMINAVVSGEADISVLLKSKEREKELLFSSPIDMTYLSFFTRTQSNADAYKLPADGYTVGVVKGSMSYEQLKRWPGLRLQDANSYEEGIFKLLAGETDLFAGEDTSIIKAARGAGLEDRIKKVGKPFVERERGIAVQKDNVRLLELFNNYLADFIGSPEYQRIYIKWYGAPAPYWTLYRILTACGILLFIIVCGMVFWRYQSITRINAALKKQIAERKQAEEIARERSRFIESVVNLSPNILYIYDLVERRNVYTNDGITTVLGYSVEEIRAMENSLVEQLMHPDDFKVYIEEAVPLYAKVKDGERITHQYRMRHKLGTWRWLDCTEIIYQRLPDGSPRQVLGMVYDVSERKLAEKKTQENEEYIRNILNTVDDGFIVVDRDYRIMTANHAYCKQASRAFDKVLGLHCYEISHLAARPCFEDGEDCPIQKVFETGVSSTAVHKHFDSDGEILYVETKAFPQKEISGNIVSVIGTTRNITERHLLEAEQLKTQKLEAIGTLAGGIAHDFNNLLQGVFGYVSMAKIDSDQPEKVLENLAQAEKALSMSVNLTTQLLTFAKGGKPVKKKIDLRPVIENAAKFALSGSRCECHFHLDPNLYPAEADEGQIAQVVQNLVLNASEAMPEGGSIDLTAENRPLSQEGRQIRIRIKDTGIGIPESYHTKIFDPYFTTKQKGSGLGLATSYSIVKNHGGSIDVESKRNKGTIFTITLPACEPEALEEKALQPDFDVQKKNGRILLMDDEEMIRNLARRMVETLGHEIELACNGEEVIGKYQGALMSENPFNLVILDLTIKGGMGGQETIRKLQEIDPNVKAVVSSGYSANPVVSEYYNYGFQGILNKPYTIKGLKECLNKMIN